MEGHSSVYNTYTDFTHFDNLPAYPKDQNFLSLMRDISTGILKENQGTKDKLYLIEELRKIKKFHFDLFAVTFNNIYQEFIENIAKSAETEVIMNSLVLISEIFSFFDFNSINEWVPDLLNIVLNLSVNENSKLKRQAFIALYNLSNNMFYEETLITLFNRVFDENEEISQNAADTLLSFIYFVDSLELVSFDWTEPVRGMLSCYLNKRGSTYLDRLGSIVTCLKNKLDKNFEFFLEGVVCSLEEKRVVMGLIKEKEKDESNLNISNSDLSGDVLKIKIAQKFDY